MRIDTGPHFQSWYLYLNTFGSAWALTISGRIDKIQRDTERSSFLYHLN
ncbi:MAG: hypothetical protein REV35_01200 [Burkholderia sp.]|nr:hypothetical protein [Burkholderia sp.]